MSQEQQGINEQLPSIQYAQHHFLKHAALEMHYGRLKTAHANDHQKYYQYAELQYFHKSKAFHFKRYFSAFSVM